MREKPILRATPLVLLVLILTCWHAIRLWTAIAWYDVLQEFAPNPGPIYAAISGAFWLASGLVLAWGIWQKKAWAVKLLLWAAAGYTVWYWIDRLAFQIQRANWLFALLLNIFLLVYVLAVILSHDSSQNDLLNLYRREPKK